MESTQVVIIGGGATGAGILWDLTLRGVSAILLERADIANGATGRCHGLLHSGGRYAVRDVATGRDCYEENLILKRIAPHCVEDCGGLFVQLAEDDSSFYDRWQKAVASAGIPFRHLKADEARALEPNLQEGLLGAFAVPDAHVDVFRLVLANIEAAAKLGGQFRSYSRVDGFAMTDDRIRAVHYTDTRTGEPHTIGCEMVVNASGGWAAEIAALAGVDAPITCDKGSLLVMNHRLSNSVINRCRIPGDGDILVPAGPVCLFGTSSEIVPGADGLVAAAAEIELLRTLGEQMVAGLREARVLRVFSGVRALYTPGNQHGGRAASRGFALLDHEEIDGVAGLVSIVGGKLTTYRKMAEATADRVCARLHVHAECKTASTPLRAALPTAEREQAEKLLPLPAVDKLEVRRGPATAQIAAAIQQQPQLAEFVCECELVTRAEVEYVLSDAALAPARAIADVGRRTRLGFGPCQGTYCGYRTMLTAFEAGKWTAEEASAEFQQYLQQRWKGQEQVEQGQQLEQLGISHELYERRSECAPNAAAANGTTEDSSC